jgi:large subunit ribosomal protein L5
MVDEKKEKKKATKEPKAEAKGAKPAKAAKGGAAAKAPRAAKGERPAAAVGEQIAGPLPRLKKHYQEKVVPELVKIFRYRNVMQAPRLMKIVVNTGVGEALQNPKAIDAASDDLARITGQRPAVRRARKSIANFKLRAGQPIGCAVTLRGARMYEFYDRLISVAIPRVRDFRGLPTRSFDGRGNFTFGLTEQIVFPEIDYDKIDRIRGLDITIVTSARTDEEGRELLRLMQMPFRTR